MPTVDASHISGQSPARNSMQNSQRKNGDGEPLAIKCPTLKLDLKHWISLHQTVSQQWSKLGMGSKLQDFHPTSTALVMVDGCLAVCICLSCWNREFKKQEFFIDFIIFYTYQPLNLLVNLVSSKTPPFSIGIPSANGTFSNTPCTFSQSEKVTSQMGPKNHNTPTQVQHCPWKMVLGR